MKATIGVYENHDDAVTALLQLKNEGFPLDQISIVGYEGAEAMNQKMQISQRGELTYQAVIACIVLGSAAGVFNGLGSFTIPGLAQLHGEGGLIGGLAGADIGLLAGIIITVAVNHILRIRVAAEYKKDLKAGKYLVTARGSGIEIGVAEGILRRKGDRIYVEEYRIPA